jgi:hypothetical protein
MFVYTAKNLTKLFSTNETLFQTSFSHYSRHARVAAAVAMFTFRNIALWARFGAATCVIGAAEYRAFACSHMVLSLHIRRLARVAEDERTPRALHRVAPVIDCVPHSSLAIGAGREPLTS